MCMHVYKRVYNVYYVHVYALVFRCVHVYVQMFLFACVACRCRDVFVLS